MNEHSINENELKEIIKEKKILLVEENETHKFEYTFNSTIGDLLTEKILKLYLLNGTEKGIQTLNKEFKITIFPSQDENIKHWNLYYNDELIDDISIPPLGEVFSCLCPSVFEKKFLLVKQQGWSWNIIDSEIYEINVIPANDQIFLVQKSNLNLEDGREFKIPTKKEFTYYLIDDSLILDCSQSSDFKIPINPGSITKTELDSSVSKYKICEHHFKKRTLRQRLSRLFCYLIPPLLAFNVAKQKKLVSDGLEITFDELNRSNQDKILSKSKEKLYQCIENEKITHKIILNHAKQWKPTIKQLLLGFVWPQSLFQNYYFGQCLLFPALYSTLICLLLYPHPCWWASGLITLVVCISSFYHLYSSWLYYILLHVMQFIWSLIIFLLTIFLFPVYDFDKFDKNDISIFLNCSNTYHQLVLSIPKNELGRENIKLSPWTKSIWDLFGLNINQLLPKLICNSKEIDAQKNIMLYDGKQIHKVYFDIQSDPLLQLTDDEIVKLGIGLSPTSILAIKLLEVNFYRELMKRCSEPQKLDTIESVYYNKSPERSHDNEKKI